MSLYTNIFRQSLKTTFHNKYLWLFGFFATLFGGNIELDLFNGIINKTNLFWQSGKFTNAGLFGSEMFGNLKASVFNSDLIIIIFFFLCLVAVIIVISTISQVGVINNTTDFIEKNEKTTLKIGVKAGMNHFWPVVVLNIISKVIVFVLLGIAFLPLVNTMENSSWGSNILFIILFLIVSIIVIALSFIIKYISGYIVVYSQRFRDAVVSGWKLFIQHWLISIEMGFMVFFISVFVSFLIIMFIQSKLSHTL